MILKRWIPSAWAEWFSVALILILSCVSRSLRGPSYELALILGLVLPVPLGLSFLFQRRALFFVEHFKAGMLFASKFSGMILMISSISWLLSDRCDFSEGLSLLILGPIAGIYLELAVVSALLAIFQKRYIAKYFGKAGDESRDSSLGLKTWLLYCLAFIGPLSGLLVSLYRYLSSPMIFAFDPFVGVFTGTPYDTEVDLRWPLLTYRLGTLFTILAWAELAKSYQEGKLRPALILWGLFSGGHIYAGTTLGHYQSSATINLALGAKSQSHQSRCEIIHDHSIEKRRALLLSAECEAHLLQLNEFFGTQSAEKVVVYLFKDAEQKSHLMGAAHTYIAKPWRREIYLQYSQSLLHPVLRHELAHIVSGELAEGPFRVAGSFGGWWPNPGKIEGYAVAAATERGSILSNREWAAAIFQIKKDFDLKSLFGLNFMLQSSSLAYTLSGAFIEDLYARFEPSVLACWYRGGDELQCFGKNFDELKKDFVSGLQKDGLSETKLQEAQLLLDMPGVFSRRCPHQSDRFFYAAYEAEKDGHFDKAAEYYREAMSIGGVEDRRELRLLGCEAQLELSSASRGETASALKNFAERTEKNDPLIAALAWEGLADSELNPQIPKAESASYRNALEAYHRAFDLSLSSDQKRRIHLKEWFLKRGNDCKKFCKQSLRRLAWNAASNRQSINIFDRSMSYTSVEEEAVSDYFWWRSAEAQVAPDGTEALFQALASFLALERDRSLALRFCDTKIGKEAKERFLNADDALSLQDPRIFEQEFELCLIRQKLNPCSKVFL